MAQGKEKYMKVQEKSNLEKQMLMHAVVLKNEELIKKEAAVICSETISSTLMPNANSCNIRC